MQCTVQEVTWVEWWVVGLIDRKTGKVKIEALPRGKTNVNQTNCMGFIRKNCLPGTAICTDGSWVYSTPQLRALGMSHIGCNHAEGQHVHPYLRNMGGVPVGTQAIESLWAQVRLFLRRMEADNIRFTQERLQEYMDIFCYRWNSAIGGRPGWEGEFERVCAALSAPRSITTG